jgi:hypothetical protein
MTGKFHCSSSASSSMKRSTVSSRTSLIRASGRSILLQDAVDHPEDAFHFAAEVRVARRVDDIDLDALPDERHVLGYDGDAPLALEIARIEDAIAHLVDIAEELALPHHGVDQGRLPVIDVGYDADVADILSAHRAPMVLSSPSGERSPGENGKNNYYTPHPKPGAFSG